MVSLGMHMTVTSLAPITDLSAPNLTIREKTICRLLAAGFTSIEIAYVFNTSTGTVHTTIVYAARKLQCPIKGKKHGEVQEWLVEQVKEHAEWFHFDPRPLYPVCGKCGYRHHPTNNRRCQRIRFRGWRPKPKWNEMDWVSTQVRAGLQPPRPSFQYRGVFRRQKKKAPPEPPNS